ncbi:MAG TPA: hypothetical protein VG225_03960 [Terracidiphilus sp.]|jgi:hypothetical protein|nr:hypothetical protein [Terracidiphilus sp.]
MENERRTILALVAAGRISAGEAERLLRAWNEKFESWWIAALCLLVCVVQLHVHVSLDGADHLVHGLVRQSWEASSAAASLLRRGMGGTI